MIWLPHRTSFFPPLNYRLLDALPSPIVARSIWLTICHYEEQRDVIELLQDKAQSLSPVDSILPVFVFTLICLLHYSVRPRLGHLSTIAFEPLRNPRFMLNTISQTHFLSKISFKIELLLSSKMSKIMILLPDFGIEINGPL